MEHLLTYLRNNEVDTYLSLPTPRALLPSASLLLIRYIKLNKKD